MKKTYQNGMTLVELMVAMLIGSVLIAGAVTVFLQSRTTYRTAESIARLQENARFAMDTLEPDVRLASFWGRTNQPAFINVPAGITVTCAGTDPVTATIWALDLTTAVETVDETIGYNLDCAGTTPRPDSDVLVVRHAAARENVVPGGAGQVQMHGDVSTGRVFDDGILPAGFGPEAETHDVIVNAYYVSNQSTFDPVGGLPALRRLSLVDGGGNGQMEDQEIMPGVENLQVQLGLDTNGNGEVDRYVDPNAVIPGATIMAIRFWMLVRSETSEAGVGFTDVDTYTTPDADLAPIQPGANPAYPAQFRRLAISKTVFLRNAQT